MAVILQNLTLAVVLEGSGEAMSMHPIHERRLWTSEVPTQAGLYGANFLGL